MDLPAFKKTPKQPVTNHPEGLERGLRSVLMHPPAKINLSLVVFNKRADNYHELHTVMATVDLCDDLHLQESLSGGISLTCTGLPSPEGPENLVYQAAQLISEFVGVNPSVKINLHKRIPAGAGLGGASSDTAACLVGMNRLLDLRLTCEDLSKIAARLGSDIPFFLQGPVALCTGRGEIVTRMSHRLNSKLLLITPDVHVSTPLVYKNYIYDNKRCNDHMLRIKYFLRRGDLDGLVDQGINTLTDVTMELFEPLRSLRDIISGLGVGPVYMSGSGSCLFVPSARDDELLEWKQLLEEQGIAKVHLVGFYDQSYIYPEVKHASFGSQNKAGGKES